MKTTHQNNERNDLRTKTHVRNFLLRLHCGFASLLHTPALWVVSLAYWAVVLLLPHIITALPDFDPLEAKALASVCVLLGFPTALLLYLALVALYGTPRHARSITESCIRAGLVNSNGEPPVALSNRNGIIELLAEGIPLDEFATRKGALETALHRRITRVLQGKDIQRIILHTASSTAQLPTEIYLDKIPPGDSMITLGMALDGPVNVDLSVMAHVLICGSTGSGKTYQILMLIHQFLLKSYSVYILNMKGGADYPRYWREVRCHLSTDLDTILETLTHLCGMRAYRQQRFDEIGDRCKDIKDYNRLNPLDRMNRVAVVCDELAEMTDQTGEDKATKEKKAAIIRCLTELARMGRNVGITLVCSLQRADTEGIPGKIRNNLDVHMVGRCADTSLIPSLLGAGKTSDYASIPLDVPGRFFCNLDGGIIFQGYLVKDLE